MTPPHGRLVLSAGGYRSGSTYLYNLLGEYVERANRGRRIGYVEPTVVGHLAAVWSFIDALGVAVGKSHDAPGVTAGAEEWEPLVADGRVVAVCTIRDWRDVLHSFSRMFRQTPEEALASRRWRINLENVRWWQAHGALTVRYERLREAPYDVLAALAQATGLGGDADAARRAVEAAAADAATRTQREVRPDTVHARTLLHPDHVDSPGGGGWRDWPAATLQRVGPVLEPLLEADGFVGGAR